jgi:SAM-dependent methyltransferase
MIEARYTSGEHFEKVPNWHVEESPWKAKHITGLMRRNKLASRTIGEVGCGFGEVLRQLQLRMPEDREFWGYEISPQAFEHALERANERLRFKLADIREEPDTFFDLMLLLDVVEHVEDYIGFLRAMKPKSQYKIIQIPLDLSVQTVLRGSVFHRLRDSLGHIHYFTKDMVMDTLKDAGYEVLDYVYTSSSLELPTDVFTTKLMWWPRRLFFACNKDLAARVLGGFRLMVLAK